MKKFYTLLLVLTSFITYSQITYEQSYFITNDGNKIECLIKNVAWKNSPVNFEYKLNENSEPETATIENVKEFNVGDSYKFVRFTVDIDLASNYVAKLDITPEPKWEKKIVFLKVLVEGDLTLYRFEDGDTIKYFYSTGDEQTATQLLYKKYVVDGMIKENNNYRQQLFNLMRDRMTNSERFKNIDYKKSSLVKLFTEYNGESNKDYASKHNQTQISLKFTPGIGFTSFSFENALNSNANFKMDGSITYSVGAELEYTLPFNNNKWALFVNPSYNIYSGSYKDDDFTVDTDYKFFQLPIGVRYYMFLDKDSKVFINGTFNLNFSMGGKITYNSNELEVGRNSSYALGAGYSYKKYSVEARYIFSHGILGPYSYWTSDYSSLNVILGYRFL